MLGRQLGHFEILSLLGQGGMGAVYQARDTHLDRLAALKVLPHDKMSDPERKRRFSQEAKAASALNHPNIITIYDIASEGDVDFIAMEYVEGHTLEAVLANGPVRISDAIKYSRQMADGLAAAHAAGILHRDLKPANVMVRSDGLVKLLDFGLAKLNDAGDSESGATRTMALTQAGSVMGTIAYMSPEQAEGKKLDYRSDIFSFGLVIYEMITGKRAFGGDSQASVIASLLRDEPQPISELRPDVPPELDYLVMRCLRKEPDRRVQTMADLKVTLDDLPDVLRTSTSIRTSVFQQPQPQQPWPVSQPPQTWSTAPPAPPPGSWPPMPPAQPWPPQPQPVPQPVPFIPPPPPRKRGFWRRYWWVVLLAVWLVPKMFEAMWSLATLPMRSMQQQQAATPKVLTAVPFTTGSGWARQPAFSRDGRHVAFSWNGGGDLKAFNIYLKSSGEGSPKQLTSGGQDFAPEWAPDGKNLAFLRNRKDVDEIIMTPTSGEQKAVKIAEIAHREGNSLAWTNDSRRLIFPDAPAPNTSVALYELTLSNGARRRLVKPDTGKDLWPALSPGGGNLAFVRQTAANQCEIFTAEMPDSDESDASAHQVTSLVAFSIHPVWTADGDDLIFASGKPGALDLWRVKASGDSTPQRFSPGDGGEDAAISLKGRRLVFSKKDSGLWIVEQFR